MQYIIRKTKKGATIQKLSGGGGGTIKKKPFIILRGGSRKRIRYGRKRNIQSRR